MLLAHATVDWGNVPAWLASLLTGGSLLIGFLILRHDRNKEEQGQARLVDWYYFPKPGDDGVSLDDAGDPVASYRVVITNRSEQSITNPIMTVARPGDAAKPLFKFHKQPGRPLQNHDLLEPGESSSAEFEVPAALPASEVLLHFNDAAGTPWVRDLFTFELRPESSSRETWVRSVQQQQRQHRRRLLRLRLRQQRNRLLGR